MSQPAPRRPEPPSRGLRRLGVVGAAVGAAATGVAAVVGAQRSAVRRGKSADGDPYADEPFDRQPYDEGRVIRTPDGTDIYLEIVEPAPDIPAGRPTVVFVHGFCLDMGTFYFQRRALAGRYRMVLYDQPGHGLSGRLGRGEYHLSVLGGTLRTVLDEAVPDGPVVLVGHSMGGMTIMALAERCPEIFGDRVVGAVLIATSGGRVQETKYGVLALVARAGTPLLALVNNTTRYTASAIDKARRATSDLSWLLTRRYGFGDPRPSAALVSYVERMNSRTSVDTVTRYLRTLYAHARHPALAALRHTPTLVIVGDKDSITPVAHSEEILRHLPDAWFVKVPGSGHVVMLEHADEVNATIMDFLDRLVS